MKNKFICMSYEDSMEEYADVTKKLLVSESQFRFLRWLEDNTDELDDVQIVLADNTGAYLDLANVPNDGKNVKVTLTTFYCDSSVKYRLILSADQLKMLEFLCKIAVYDQDYYKVGRAGPKVISLVEDEEE